MNDPHRVLLEYLLADTPTQAFAQALLPGGAADLPAPGKEIRSF